VPGPDWWTWIALPRAGRLRPVTPKQT